MRWTREQAGRVWGTIRESADQGDLLRGDLDLHECFAASGELQWRQISPAYADQLPGYNFGEEDSCAFTAEDLAR